MPSRTWPRFLALGALALAARCDAKQSPPMSAEGGGGGAASPRGDPAAKAPDGAGQARDAPAGKAEAAAKQDDAPLTERMIVYTAHLDVIVDDLDPARERLAQLVAQHKAYVAASEITGNVGSRRTGTWTLR